MIRAPRAFILALLAFALSACGFHLRNALTLPEDLGPVRVVSSDPYSPLGQSLSQALSRIGAVPAAEDATDNVATLEVLSERWGNTAVSLDELGRAQEYSLRYAVVFALRKADGSEVVPRQTVEISRDYIAPPADSIGTASEREILAKELRREMTSTILRRIDSVTRKPKS